MKVTALAFAPLTLALAPRTPPKLDYTSNFAIGSSSTVKNATRGNFESLPDTAPSGGNLEQLSAMDDKTKFTYTQSADDGSLVSGSITSIGNDYFVETLRNGKYDCYTFSIPTKEVANGEPVPEKSTPTFLKTQKIRGIETEVWAYKVGSGKSPLTMWVDRSNDSLLRQVTEHNVGEQVEFQVFDYLLWDEKPRFSDNAFKAPTGCRTEGEKYSEKVKEKVLKVKAMKAMRG